MSPTFFRSIPQTTAIIGRKKNYYTTKIYNGLNELVPDIKDEIISKNQCCFTDKIDPLSCKQGRVIEEDDDYSE